MCCDIDETTISTISIQLSFEYLIWDLGSLWDY